MNILAGEKAFFAAIAGQVGMQLDALMTEIAEQDADADKYTPPCVQFDDSGHVRAST